MDVGTTVILGVLLVLVLFVQVAAFRFSEKLSLLNDKLDRIADQLNKKDSI